MKLCNVMFFVSLAFLVDGYSCRCEKCIKNIPENVQVLPLEKCTEYTRYEFELGPAKEDGKLFEKILKKRVVRFNNVAGTIIIFPDGSRKEVYRSAFLSESPKALEELVKKRKIKTIINVYNTDKFDITPWVEKEKRLFDSYGGSTYIHVRDFKYRYETEEEKQIIFKKIRSILQMVRCSEGNVLIHCMGGEHNTGVIFAILRKLYQQVDLDVIVQEYKCHCGWVSDDTLNGVYQVNIDIIKEFPNYVDE